MNNLRKHKVISSPLPSRSLKILHLVYLICAIALLFTGSKVKAQATVLVAGDIVFSGYDASSTPAATSEPYDRVSLVTLVQLNAGTVIYFTDRGYFGNGNWSADNGTSEGTYTWTVGANVAAGTEITVITHPTQKAVIIGGAPNGTLVSATANSTISLNDTGDQFIVFQGPVGDPADANVNLIAGLHWGYCSSGGTNNTTDAAWDPIGSSGCTGDEGSSILPPGLVAGNSALWAGVSLDQILGLSSFAKAQFNASGLPLDNTADIRTATMVSSNWLPIRLGVNADLNVPTGLFVEVLPVKQNGLNAKINGNVLTVNWYTETETNNKHFIVQTSTNGSTWKDIGTVASKASNGNSTTRLDYSFTGSIGNMALAGLGLLGLLLLPSLRNRLARFGMIILVICAIAACKKNDGMDNSLENSLKPGQSVYVRIAQVDLDGKINYSNAVVAKK